MSINASQTSAPSFHLFAVRTLKGHSALLSLFTSVQRARKAGLAGLRR